MDVQGNAGTLVCAIQKVTIIFWLTKRLALLCAALHRPAIAFLKSDLRPADVHQFECRVEEIVREMARSFEEWCFNVPEPQKVKSMPLQVEYQGQAYRRLKHKTPHAQILTRFGNITLTRAVYRLGSRGRTIAPLEIALGIQCGMTPSAQDLVGRQLAATGSSQGRCIQAIAERTGVRMGPEKLRRLSSHLAENMEPQREECQEKRLGEWMDEAGKHGRSVTLAVSRDGVSLGIAPFGNFEMASVATLSVYADGKRTGTVYLACSPEENQETISQNLTSLLKRVIRVHGSKLRRIIYVTDAGKIETAYWKNVLRHLFVDGQRIKIERVVDYYHASLRLTSIADALKLTSSQRTLWLQHVRRLLLEPGGWGRVMRSIAFMVPKYGIKPAHKDEYEKAKRYLHRYRRFMNYMEHRSQGSPIGSGIVESACKQIVTERLRLSGMRWKHDGAARIMTLRPILLSQTWSATFKQALLALPPVSILSTQKTQCLS